MKEFWGKLAKKTKVLIGIVGVLILGLAIGLTVYMNASSKAYTVLYPNISEADTAEVFAAIQGMGLTPAPEINAQGQVTVPADQWDSIVWELAQKGLPASSPPYGMFLDNVGFTTTETEKLQIMQFQLQDRIQETLRHVDGVQGAIVTITLPKSSNYVWDKKEEKPTASVMLDLAPQTEFTPEQVSAVKTLVSHSVSQMLPEDVMVMDTTSGQELGGIDSENASYNTKRLDFERELASIFEEKANKILVPRYGKAGVTVAASVKLNYDKIKTEEKTLLARDENNNPIVSHKEESYTINGAQAGSVEGIVGEENNTDLPVYKAQDPNATTAGVGDATQYDRSIDYSTGYTMKQIEQDPSVLKEASIAVLVNDPNFDTTTEDTIKQLVAKATGIDPGSIMATNLFYTDPVVDTPANATPTPATGLSPVAIIILAGIGVLILIVAIVLAVLYFRRKEKEKKLEEEQKTEETIKTLQQEIDEHKNSLRDAAQASNSKENAIANEIRTFAKENPEITASLIRSMLKEEE